MPLDWSGLSEGVAALVVLMYSIRTVRAIAKDNQTFLSNHMSTNTAAMQDVAVNLATLNEKVVDFKEDNTRLLAQLHKDNLVMARELRKSDKTVTRKVEEQNEFALKKRLDTLEEGGKQ